MARQTRFEFPTDTSLFTPLQLQPRGVFGLAMTGWTRWLQEHWGTSFPALIREKNLGVVIASLDLQYLRPLQFFDTHALVATVSVSVTTKGNLLYVVVSLAPAHRDEEIARVVAVLRPVRIAERLALSAVPGDLDADVLATFAEDEFVSPASKRRIRQIVADVEAGAPAVATSLRSYTLHRHLCEVADQWSAIALPDLTSEVRERLVTESEDIPALNAAFVSPMRRMTMEFWRPAFFLDEFTIDCRAYERDGDVIFVHRFLRANDGEPLTTSVEWLTTTVNLMANQQTDELVKGEAR